MKPASSRSAAQTLLRDDIVDFLMIFLGCSTASGHLKNVGGGPSSSLVNYKLKKTWSWVLYFIFADRFLKITAAALRSRRTTIILYEEGTNDF